MHGDATIFQSATMGWRARRRRSSTNAAASRTRGTGRAASASPGLCGTPSCPRNDAPAGGGRLSAVTVPRPDHPRGAESGSRMPRRPLLDSGKPPASHRRGGGARDVVAGDAGSRDSHREATERSGSPQRRRLRRPLPLAAAENAARSPERHPLRHHQLSPPRARAPAAGLARSLVDLCRCARLAHLAD